MSSPATTKRAPEAPILTPIVVRRMSRWSQVRLAAAAGTSVATVRLYEADALAVRDPQIRRSLAGIYERLKVHLLTCPQPP